MFYNGLLHPVLVTSHLLLILALGLFLGQQGIRENQPAVIVFLFAIIAGLAASWFANVSNLETVVLFAAALLGLLIATGVKLDVYWCSFISAVAGVFAGMDSAQEVLSGKDKFVSLFGSGVGLYFLSLYPMAFADYFKKQQWQKISVRVFGSWIATSSLLVLALTFAR